MPFIHNTLQPSLVDGQSGHHSTFGNSPDSSANRQVNMKASKISTDNRPIGHQSNDEWSEITEKDTPVLRAVERTGRILCRPVLGGLHAQG
jgi:hypothetical protein